jgi:putative transposase
MKARTTMTTDRMALGELLEKGSDADLLRALTRRGLRGVRLVISDAHEGLKAAAAKVLGATWQRRRIHFFRNAMAHVGPSQRAMVAAAIRTAFAQESGEATHRQWRQVADGLRERFRRLAELMDEAEHDVLAYMAFHPDHWTKISSTNPLERLNGAIKRRTDVWPSSPTTRRSPDWRGRSCSNRTTSGPSAAAT